MSTPAPRPRMPAVMNYLSLFTSLGTLLCCALPSLLVLLGLGASVASFLSAVPFMVTLSKHKVWMFLASGTMIGLSFAYVYCIAPSLQAAVCPPDDPSACEVASKFSKVALWTAAILFGIGFFVAYLLGPILERME